MEIAVGVILGAFLSWMSQYVAKEVHDPRPTVEIVQAGAEARRLKLREFPELVLGTTAQVSR